MRHNAPCLEFSLCGACVVDGADQESRSGGIFVVDGTRRFLINGPAVKPGPGQTIQKKIGKITVVELGNLLEAPTAALAHREDIGIDRARHKAFTMRS